MLDAKQPEVHQLQFFGQSPIFNKPDSIFFLFFFLSKKLLNIVTLWLPTLTVVDFQTFSEVDKIGG